MSESDAAAGASGASLLRDEPLTVEVVTSERAFEGKVWDIRRDTFLYDGAPTTREYVAHTGAAAIVALDDEGRVLLIQQYRHPIGLRDWEVPAGLLDIAGETPLETAQRELAEEADVAADVWEPLVSVYSTPGGSNEVIHLFLARGLRPIGEAHAREAEEADIRVEWVPLTDAVAAVLDGRMRNGILATGLLAAAERVRRADAEGADGAASAGGADGAAGDSGLAGS